MTAKQEHDDRELTAFQRFYRFMTESPHQREQREQQEREQYCADMEHERAIPSKQPPPAPQAAGAARDPISDLASIPSPIQAAIRYLHMRKHRSNDQDLLDLMDAFERDGKATGCLNDHDVHRNPEGRSYSLRLTQNMFCLYCAGVATGASKVVEVMRERVNNPELGDS